GRLSGGIGCSGGAVNSNVDYGAIYRLQSIVRYLFRYE
ncbi:hypothetical protein MNBD_ACTINO02-2634, partial [hydrothermal vent metagenome]